MGETLDVSTMALLAGAAGAAGAIFALPADDRCTGTMAATVLGEFGRGTPLGEALRRARASYLADAPDGLKAPGGRGVIMPGTAPWAWAGLVAFTR
jgi:hypothetical protein